MGGLALERPFEQSRRSEQPRPVAEHAPDRLGVLRVAVELPVRLDRLLAAPVQEPLLRGEPAMLAGPRLDDRDQLVIAVGHALAAQTAGERTGGRLGERT